MKTIYKQSTKTTDIARRAYIGFTILDIVHLLCSITMLVVLFVHANEGIDTMVFAECNVEIVMSLLLIAFITSLAKQDRHEHFRPLYTFAWLVAITSVMVPLLFEIPEIITGKWSQGSEALALFMQSLCLLLSVAIFLTLLLTSHHSHRSHAWNISIRVPMVLVLVLATAKFATEFTLQLGALERTLECIKDVALLVPAILSITLWHNRNFRD